MKTTTAKTNFFDQLFFVRKHRWMIVDDNTDFLPILREVLARLTDAEICCFSSPVEALRAFEAAPDSFQLVLTDFDMPGMNGFELLQHLRAAAPKVNAILATGNFDVSEHEAIRHGFRHLLRKPFTLADLGQAIAAVQRARDESECAAHWQSGALAAVA